MSKIRYRKLTEELRDLELIKAEKAKRSFRTFVELFWSVLNPSDPLISDWYLDAICDHLQNIKQIKNLLVNMCPGFGKTTLISVLFPAWQWLQNPSERFLCTSYALQLSIRDSVNCRRVIEDPLFRKYYSSYFTLTSDQNMKAKFENSERGYRLATSVNGTNTGERASIIIVDDPISVPSSQNDAAREACITWWAKTMPSRLNDQITGCKIIVGQRVHENDLSGFLLKTSPSTWCHLSLPLEYQGKDTHNNFGWKDPRTEIGELLSSRFDAKTIKKLKAEVGSQAYSSQYLQDPAPATGELYQADWFRYYSDNGENYTLGERLIAKNSCWRFASVDLAISKSTRADYTVAGVFDVSKDGDMIFLHMKRGRIDGLHLVPTLAAMNASYKPRYWLMEDVAFQRLILMECRRAGLVVRSFRPEGEKVERAITLRIKAEAGQVWFPKDTSWVHDAELELLKFGPGCARDDIVDCMSSAANEVQKRCRNAPNNLFKPPELTAAQVMHQRLFGDLLR